MTTDTTTVIDGVSYLSVPSPNKSCDGCAGDNNKTLCGQLPPCFFDRVVFLRQGPAPTPKVEVTMISVPQAEWDAYIASRQVVNEFAARSEANRLAMQRAQEIIDLPEPIMPRPLARRSDPETSHVAAEGMARKAGRIRDLILIELRDNGPMNGSELSLRTGVALNSVTPRFASLRRAGLIHAAGGRGRETVWAIGNGVSA